MSTTWLSKVYNFDVERREIPRGGGKAYIPMGQTQIGVLHTTEGFGVDSAWNTLKNHPGGPAAPHFVIGENRIVQCRPIGVQSAALRGAAPFFDNQYASVQIEMCGFTGGNSDFAKHGMDAWMPVDETLQPLIALMAYCASNGIDIPLQRPSADWKDDCTDIKGIWATDHNTRRQSGIWPKEKGWYFHLEVPHNNHYDCGAMGCAELFAAAKALAESAPQATQPSTTALPDSTSPTPSTGIIKQGDTGAQVKQLQTQLIALGYLGQGAADGNFGPHTLNAVRKFQSDQGLHVDGIVGPATNAALSKAAPSSASGGN